MAMQKSGKQRRREALADLPRGVRLYHAVEEHSRHVLSVGFDPQGEILASGSLDNTINFWGMQARTRLLTLSGHQDRVWSVAFDYRGETFASGSGDRTVRLWEAQSGKLLHSLKGHTGPVWSVAFNPQAEIVASGSSDGTVRTWDTHTGQQLRTTVVEGPVSSVAFDSSGSRFATSGATASLWDAHTWKLLVSYQSRTFNTAVFDSLGSMLAYGGLDHSVRVIDARNGHVLRVLEGHTRAIDIIAFSPDGRLLASKSKDDTIRLWSCESWKTVAILPESGARDFWIPALAFHPTLPLLATSGSGPRLLAAERSPVVHLYELDYDTLLGRRDPAPAVCAVRHTTGQIVLPDMAEPIRLAPDQREEVESQLQIAEQRTRFEQSVSRIRAFVADQKIAPPTSFISYAWGVTEHERWVEKRLATDLQKAGIVVLLDRWDNVQIGASIARFVERIDECDRIVVVGTPLYRQKAKNLASASGSVSAAEWDLAGMRMLTTEDQKRTVLPVLLAGEESEAFPPLLRGRVYGDFRKEEAYFITAFDLILGLYGLPPNHPAVADLRESLREPGIR